MKKQLGMVGIVFLFVPVVGLSRCNSNPRNTKENRFEGTWAHPIGRGIAGDTIIPFSSDETARWWI